MRISYSSNDAIRNLHLRTAVLQSQINLQLQHISSGVNDQLFIEKHQLFHFGSNINTCRKPKIYVLKMYDGKIFDGHLPLCSPRKTSLNLRNGLPNSPEADIVRDIITLVR